MWDRGCLLPSGSLPSPCPQVPRGWVVITSHLQLRSGSLQQGKDREICSDLRPKSHSSKPVTSNKEPAQSWETFCCSLTQRSCAWVPRGRGEVSCTLKLHTEKAMMPSMEWEDLRDPVKCTMSWTKESLCRQMAAAATHMMEIKQSLPAFSHYLRLVEWRSINFYLGLKRHFRDLNTYPKEMRYRTGEFWREKRRELGETGCGNNKLLSRERRQPRSQGLGWKQLEGAQQEK